MNKTIINKRVIDHSRTERIFKEIMSKVRKQAAAYLNYMEKMDESKDQAMYSAQYLKGFADEALELLVSIAKNNMEEFSKLIDEAKDVEQANDSAPLNIADPAIQGAITILNTMGEKMDNITLECIVKPFVGQWNALVLLENIIEMYNLNIHKSKNIAKYFYNTESLFTSLFEELTQLRMQPKNIMVYQKVLTAIIDTAVTLGIELSDADLEVGISSDILQTTSMRAVMGLSE